MANAKCYPFAYDGITNTAPDPGNNVANSKTGKTMAVEFQIESRNFATESDPEGTCDYAFRLQSVYLVEEKKRDVSSPKNRKRGPDVLAGSW